MICNPLYFFPVEANRLYHAKKETKEFRSALKQIQQNIDISEYCDLRANDKTAGKLVRKQKTAMMLVFVFAFAGLGAAFILWLADKLAGESDIFIAALFIIVMVSFLIELSMCMYVLRLKRKLILHYLETYQPVCEDFDEETLSKAGLYGLRTVGNRVDIEDCCFDVEDDESEHEFTSCRCIFCMKCVKNSDITDFDESNSAICPYCRKTSLMYSMGEVSDNFINILNTYWSAVNSL